MSTAEQFLAGVVPSIGVGLVFWYAMRAIVRADRRERQALARLDALESARHATEDASS
ncbi:MAG TPA: hypothetical protein VGK35_15245 [Actinotalea sp.]|jgi:hypothetical protein